MLHDSCCRYLELVGFDDINDPRNGLLLAKPIKWAFDTSQLISVYDEALDIFNAMLLNPALRPISLAVKTEELMQVWRGYMPPSLLMPPPMYSHGDEHRNT